MGTEKREPQGIGRFKPGVAPTVHLLLAALFWSGAGLFLLVRGIILLKSGDGLWLIGAGILLGFVKSFFILDRSARRVIMRIGQFGDHTCIGAVYSWKTWFLVLAMIVSGITIRQTIDGWSLSIGTICVAIGCGLIYSSRFAWRALFDRQTGV
ncbi:hypothetical protein [Desulfofustis glycolicus]|uniref:Uncharacterized protein n=1 Tax=Desulfofustis glycolicus DSM 9705 TaxID=1121409 RepID=A0A1M5W879_9BACT|nr:hypothetical protein [Desulfofustis glycolicus]MCB2217319.1 hypothetical protein [Desulfobulbaceae bacterium]SHH83687.1 hypothetical protein SAMN02745124_02143 [Desulfofustis glycolicus DSM 9705]